MLRGVDIDFAGRGARDRAEDGEILGGRDREARQQRAHEAEGRVGDDRRRRAGWPEFRRERHREALLERLQVAHDDLGDLYAESGQTCKGSFSAVSTPIFASKYSLESSRRDLHNAFLCTVL